MCNYTAQNTQPMQPLCPILVALSSHVGAIGRSLNNICTVTFLIHPILFGLIYLMMSVYFHKAQVTMLRGYALYLEYTFWFVFAECSTRRAQETLRRFDPKCRFKFSYVPEPVVDEAEEERIANLMREARAQLEAEVNS